MLNKYILNAKFDFFFIKAKNLICLSNGTFFNFFFLPSFFFFSFNSSFISFFFNNVYFFKSFFSHFKLNYQKLFFIFFSRFKLRGLGYRVKHICAKLVRFFIGTTNFYYFHAPTCIFMQAKRRKLLLVSYDKFVLRTVFLHLTFLKKIIPYKLRGFFFPRQIILMKPGKKRF